MAPPKNARIPQSDARDIWGPVTTVIVGETKSKIVIHNALLNSSSNVFKVLMVIEGVHSSTIILEYNELEIFKIYVHWLYFGAIPLPTAQNPKTKAFEEFECLARIYVLGETLEDTKFKNTILETMMTMSIDNDRCLNSKVIAIIYEGTPANSPARRLLVDFYTHCANGEKGWNDLVRASPVEFAMDAVVAIAKIRRCPMTEPWMTAPETYHE